MRQACISQQLPFFALFVGCNIFFNFGDFTIFLYYLCDSDFCLCAKYWPNWAEKKMHFALLEFAQCIVMVLCVAVSVLLWSEKKGLLTRFLRPYFAHSNLHGPFAFWMTGCTALTQSHYGHSHISNTFASQHCTLAHVNCVKLLVYQPLSPKVFFVHFFSLLSCMSVEMCDIAALFHWPLHLSLLLTKLCAQHCKVKNLLP